MEHLDWKFYPEKNTLDLKPGEVHTVKFNVENSGQRTICRLSIF